MQSRARPLATESEGPMVSRISGVQSSIEPRPGSLQQLRRSVKRDLTCFLRSGMGIISMVSHQCPPPATKQASARQRQAWFRGSAPEVWKTARKFPTASKTASITPPELTNSLPTTTNNNTPATTITIDSHDQRGPIDIPTSPRALSFPSSALSARSRKGGDGLPPAAFPDVCHFVHQRTSRPTSLGRLPATGHSFPPSC